MIIRNYAVLNSIDTRVDILSLISSITPVELKFTGGIQNTIYPVSD